MVNYVGVYLNYQSDFKELFKKAIDAVSVGGKLDVVVSPTPNSLSDAQEIVCSIYELVAASSVEFDVAVLFEDTHCRDWEYSLGLKVNLAPEFLQKYNCVAVGGTWDHLHWGHRLMLTMAAITAKDRVIIGVTESELLKNKKYASALDSYEVRAEAATQIIHRLRKNLQVHIFPLHDMYGPTVKIQEIEALVVSKETSSGGDQINKLRSQMGWPDLDLLEVGFIKSSSASDKLSSTELRKAQVEREECSV